MSTREYGSARRLPGVPAASRTAAAEAAWPMQTVCLGQAASAAAVLLAAGTPGKRLALPYSRVLIHQPSGESGGQVSDLEIHAAEIQRVRSQMEEILARHTGQTVDQVRTDIERDKILTAEEAKAYGIVDEVIQSRKLNALPA